MALQLIKITKFYQFGKNKQTVLNNLTIKFPSKGLIAIVVTLFSGKSKEEILNLDIDNSFAKIGLQEHLSPSRRNGLEAMLEKIKFYAQSLG